MREEGKEDMKNREAVRSVEEKEIEEMREVWMRLGEGRERGM